MRELLRKHHISFKNAFAGLFWAIRVHPNFRVHILSAVFALGLGFFLSLSLVEMTIIVFTILLVFTTEMINTSIEAMTDLITKEWRQDAKIAKDVSAGMTLVAAIGAVVVGALIFIPHILAYFSIV